MRWTRTRTESEHLARIADLTYEKHKSPNTSFQRLETLKKARHFNMKTKIKMLRGKRSLKLV